MWFKMKPTTPFRGLMDRFCEQNGVTRQDVNFYFDGDLLPTSETPQDWEMEDGDVIDVSRSPDAIKAAQRAEEEAKAEKRREQALTNAGHSRQSLYRSLRDAVTSNELGTLEAAVATAEAAIASAASSTGDQPRDDLFGDAMRSALSDARAAMRPLQEEVQERERDERRRRREREEAERKEQAAERKKAAAERKKKERAERAAEEQRLRQEHADLDKEVQNRVLKAKQREREQVCVCVCIAASARCHSRLASCHSHMHCRSSIGHHRLQLSHASL